MTTEERKKAALDALNKKAPWSETTMAVSDEHLETIRELLQPAPQNREADIEAALDRIAKAVEKRHGTTVCYDAADIIRAELIRADLANKPALDAEVREAIKDLSDDAFMLETGAGNNIGTPKKMAAQIKTLIRAASAVQEKK